MNELSVSVYLAAILEISFLLIYIVELPPEREKYIEKVYFKDKS